MYRCELCNTILLKRNKSKHNKTKKHKCYSNLILKSYFIKNVEVNNFKDLFDAYFIEHTKIINFLEVCVSLRFGLDNDLPSHKLNIANDVSYKIKSEHYSIYTTEPANDFFT